ncbi:MAG: response regulator transcription factor [Bacteroidales bacterium]|nr:response regulator transcription factor [Bacteroidales bacterium]MDD4604637.1 response regulator transcription factor [Bacteroidales bacterium]
MKVLLIEDEKELALSILAYLQKESYLCEAAYTFREASEKIDLYKYDCILVDINLPDGSGLNVIRELKAKKSETGIIIISAKNSLDDKVDGLGIGADDYLTKPFHLSELNARIKSVIRRRSFGGVNEIVFNEIRIQPDKMEVFVNDQAIILTKKEYDLLIFFLSNKDRVVTKESIAEHLWGDDMDLADSFDFIYTHIKNLRKKIMDKGGEDYIRTIYGMGYKFSRT